MARHKGLPRPEPFILRKQDLLRDLRQVDESKASRHRVLAVETELRARIDTHVRSLPSDKSAFAKFHTNPFVLMFHCFKQGYHRVSQIERDILPAKLFMSMETSSGRMVEAVALPIYDWSLVPSAMHSTESVIDARQRSKHQLRLATLKSGPRCLNDEMSKNIADDIVTHCRAWADDADVSEIEFTYGVLYGTRRQSNKKDWHILRNINEAIGRSSRKGKMLTRPSGAWTCSFETDGLKVSVTVRIGVELWNHVAGHDLAFTELCAALVRACVLPSDIEPKGHEFTVSDLRQIVSLDTVPKNYNVSILQRSQLEWLFLFARHFCDEIE